MKDVKFWCAVGVVKQGAFRDDGSTYEVEKESPVGEQHILYQGVLMCGKSREGIKGYRKAKRQKTVQLRIENVPLCKKCQEKYKANGNLPFSKWTIAARGTGKSAMAFDAFVQEVKAVELHGVKTSALS